MHFFFLIGLLMINLLIPMVYMMVTIIRSIHFYNEARAINARHLNSIQKNLRPPPDFESKYPKEFIKYMAEYTRETENNWTDYYKMSDHDAFNDFIFWLQMGQSSQILISIGIAAFFYVTDVKYTSLVIFLQGAISSVFGILIILIRQKYYPREIKELR